jgi:hypothetical protein
MVPLVKKVGFTTHPGCWVDGGAEGNELARSPAGWVKLAVSTTQFSQNSWSFGPDSVRMYRMWLLLLSSSTECLGSQSVDSLPGFPHPTGPKDYKATPSISSSYIDHKTRILGSDRSFCDRRNKLYMPVCRLSCKTLSFVGGSWCRRWQVNSFDEFVTDLHRF